jgi:dATP pyrophosphohydrolase
MQRLPGLRSCVCSAVSSAVGRASPETRPSAPVSCQFVSLAGLASSIARSWRGGVPLSARHPGDTVAGGQRYHGDVVEASGSTVGGERERVAGRAAFQVLVFPYRPDGGAGFRYALFRRADDAYWQGVAGGGEAGESALDAARREAAEEAGLPKGTEFTALDSMATMPVVNVTGDFRWGPDVLVVPEHTFGALCDDDELRLSDEHTEYRWFSFDEAKSALRWDSNRNALWELDHRLRHGLVHSTI